MVNMGQCTRFFFGVFTHFSKFSRHAWEKIPNMLVFTRVYVCVKAKLTFVSFFLDFFILNLSLGQNILNGQKNMLTSRTSDFSVTYHLQIPLLLL